MKNPGLLLITFLLIFSLSCFAIVKLDGYLSSKEKSQSSTENSTNNNEPLPNGDSSANEESQKETIKEEAPSTQVKSSFSKYFPTKEALQISYTGNFEYGSSIDTIQYIKNNKIQVLSVCKTRIQKVYQISDEGVFIINQKEMKDDEIPSSIMENNNEPETLVKGPLKLGTTWSDKDGNSFEITGVDKPCITKAGEFLSLEITKKEKSSKNITKIYYGNDTGLIKSVTRDVKDNIISIKQAEKIEGQK